MFKKYLTLTLLMLITNLFFSISISAQTQNDNNNPFIINIKKNIAKVWTEPNRQLKIKQKDGTKLKGYVTEMKEDHFVMVDSKTGKITNIQYTQIVEAKRDGLSKFASILVGTGVAIGLLVGLSAIVAASEGY